MSLTDLANKEKVERLFDILKDGVGEDKCQ